MRHDADGFAHGPMGPERYAELVELKQAGIAGAPASPPVAESFVLPTRSSDLALQILAEALERRLTGGELLVLFDEAAMHETLAGLESAANGDSNLLPLIIEAIFGPGASTLIAKVALHGFDFTGGELTVNWFRDFASGGFFTGWIILILSEVFRQGADMKREQSLTI